jgi:lipid II:glycine glycyltransferase (peptidoglycan interpeptide bridge formation enzyme)
MTIILYANKGVHYHLSALDRDYQQLAPMNLMLYEVACWGCDHGYKTFHLGGGVGSKEDNLYVFKSSFNKNSYSVFSIGRKCFNRQIYGNLVERRKLDKNFDINSSYFPLYRA